MKAMVWMAVCAALILSGAVRAEDEAAKPTIQVKPVQIVSCADLPDGLDFSVKPMCYSPGFQVFYLLEGENLVSVKDDSVTLAYIRTPKGTDISKNRMGRAAYEMGSFPKVSEDGKHGIFSVKVKQNQFAHVGQLSIKGTVTVLTGSQHEEKSVELSVTDPQKKTVGPFSAVVTKGGGSFMGFGGGDNKSIGIRCTGPLDSVIKLTLMDGTQELDSSGSMTVNGVKTYSFQKPNGKKVTFKISYWTNLKETVVPFGR